MWNTLGDDHRKMLGAGAAAALAFGLMAGAALRPVLNVDHLGGPQTLVAGGGARSLPAYAVTSASTRPTVPYYVYGTDALRTAAAYQTQTDQEPQLSDRSPDNAALNDPRPAVIYPSHAEAPPPNAARAAWRETPPPEPVFPSERGGVAYEANHPAPPPPLEYDLDDIDDY